MGHIILRVLCHVVLVEKLHLIKISLNILKIGNTA